MRDQPHLFQLASTFARFHSYFRRRLLAQRE